ncbi:hypothetical protein EJ110_NYTH28558, partial [Nymphaea thermarum]
FNSFICTYRFTKEEEAGLPIYPNFFALAGVAGFMGLAVFMVRMLTGQINLINGLGLANTALAFINNTIMALWESDLPYATQLTPDGDVETVGRWDFGGELSKGMAFAWLILAIACYGLANPGPSRPGWSIQSQAGQSWLAWLEIYAQSGLAQSGLVMQAWMAWMATYWYGQARFWLADRSVLAWPARRLPPGWPGPGVVRHAQDSKGMGNEVVLEELEGVGVIGRCVVNLLLIQRPLLPNALVAKAPLGIKAKEEVGHLAFMAIVTKAIGAISGSY